MEIDLNSDMGEGFGRWRIADDAALMRLVSSANVACGYHAGDPLIMSSMVEMAKQNGVDIGAHVGFPDLVGFGRTQMQVVPAEFAKHVLYQLGALHAIAVSAGYRVSHLSFHGALGNMAAVDRDLAETLVGAAASFDRTLIFSTSPSSEVLRAAQRLGLATVGKFLADRAYDRGGQLVSRKVPGSVIKDPQEVARRIVRLLDDGSVETIDGERLRVDARSILVHSDTPGAVDLATTIRQAVEARGGRIVPLTRLTC